jgi:hypothetical protein
MPAAAPFQITIPDSGVAAGFTNDERALAVASPHSATPAGVYYLSRLINLQGGVYTLKINGASACSAWVGEDLSTTSRVASYGGVQSSPISADFFVRPGTTRLDLVLSSLGGLIGMGLAALASFGLASVMDMPYMFQPGINLLAFLFSAGIGVLFGYFPARRAARLDPIEALRHE